MYHLRDCRHNVGIIHNIGILFNRYMRRYAGLFSSVGVLSDLFDVCFQRYFKFVNHY